MRVCLECGCDISDRRPNAKRCKTCAIIYDRKNSNDKRKRNTWGDKEYFRLRYETRKQQRSNCAVCGWEIEGLESGGCHIHHIKPICEGGKDDIENVVMLCPNCHALAHHGLITQDQLNGLRMITVITRPDYTQIMEIINTKLRPNKPDSIKWKRQYCSGD